MRFSRLNLNGGGISSAGGGGIGSSVVAGRDTAKHSTRVLEVARHVLTGVESMVTDVNPLRSATNVPLRMLLVQAALR